MHQFYTSLSALLSVYFVGADDLYALRIVHVDGSTDAYHDLHVSAYGNSGDDDDAFLFGTLRIDGATVSEWNEEFLFGDIEQLSLRLYDGDEFVAEAYAFKTRLVKDCLPTYLRQAASAVRL